MLILILSAVAFTTFALAVDRFNRLGNMIGGGIWAVVFIASIILMFPAYKLQKKWAEEAEWEKRHNIKPTRSQELAGDIGAGIVAFVLMEILALGMFFLVWVACKLGDFKLLFVLLPFGVLFEIISVSFLCKIRKYKAMKKEEDLHPTEQTVLPGTLYKNKGYTYDPACEQYCKQFNKNPKELTREDRDIIWEYSYDDFTYLMMWIFENGFYQPSSELEDDEAKEARKYVSAIKKRETNPTEYLISYDGYFMEEEIKKKARDFVKTYYKESFEQELAEFAKETLGAELYGFPFRFEDYDAFKPNIDAAYERYQIEKEIEKF